MQTHVKVTGWLYIVLGVFGLLAAGLVFLAVAGGGWISGDRTAIRVTMLVATLVASLIVLLSLPGIVVGAGLLRFQPWARVLGLVLAIINLPGFPIGTLLGVYAIWALLDDESSRLFAGEGEIAQVD